MPQKGILHWIRRILIFFYRFILMFSQMPLSQKSKEGPYLDLVRLALRLGVCGNPMNPPNFGKH